MGNVCDTKSMVVLMVVMVMIGVVGTPRQRLFLASLTGYGVPMLYSTSISFTAAQRTLGDMGNYHRIRYTCRHATTHPTRFCTHPTVTHSLKAQKEKRLSTTSSGSYITVTPQPISV